MVETSQLLRFSLHCALYNKQKQKCKLKVTKFSTNPHAKQSTKATVTVAVLVFATLSNGRQKVNPLNVVSPIVTQTRKATFSVMCARAKNNVNAHEPCLKASYFIAFFTFIRTKLFNIL